MNVLEYFEERFGIKKENFDDFGLYMGTKGKVYLGPKKLISEPKITSPGLLIARAESSVKPTTNFLQLFGYKATKNIIEVSKQDAAKYAKGEDLRAEGDDGYVIVKYSGTVLGCGFLKQGIISNQIPKAKRQELKFY